MNQDQRRAKAAIESGQMRMALQAAMFNPKTINVLVEWAENGCYAASQGDA